MNALRISLAHQNHKRSFVDDASLRKHMPIRSDKATLLQSISVALDRENRDLRFNALENLVGHRLRAGERRGEMNVEVVFTFGLGRERRINRFLKRLLHDRKA